MFSYNKSLLYMNNDDTLIQLLVPTGGVPIGTRIHNVIYVSATYLFNFQCSLFDKKEL